MQAKRWGSASLVQRKTPSIFEFETKASFHLSALGLWAPMKVMHIRKVFCCESFLKYLWPFTFAIATHTILLCIYQFFHGASHPQPSSTFFSMWACDMCLCSLEIVLWFVFGNSSRLLYFSFPITISPAPLSRFRLFSVLMLVLPRVRLHSHVVSAHKLFLLFIDIIMCFVMECLKSRVPRITTLCTVHTHAGRDTNSVTPVCYTLNGSYSFLFLPSSFLWCVVRFFFFRFRMKFSAKCDSSECEMDRIIYKSTRIRKING